MKVNWMSFLKDVFLCSLGAYGGPEAHYGVFIDQLVVKKAYIKEEDIAELIALTSILPGPSSTQSIIAIGYRLGGPWLGALTFLVWALPILIFMTLLSFLSQWFIDWNLSADVLRFVSPMAVGFMGIASYRLGKKSATDKLTIALFMISTVISVLVQAVWVYPVLLLLGGVASVVTSSQKQLWHRVGIKAKWHYFIVFVGLAIGSFIAVQWTSNIVIQMFEMFYRYGYLVIGGGQVVVPMMHTELVETHHVLTSQEFLTGYGLVQGLPGPMFGFGAYAAGMASRGGSALTQVFGAMAGGIGIFLPGILLIYFVYPIWEKVKTIPGIKVSLRGVHAVTAGLVAASAIVLLQKVGGSWEALAVVVLSMLLLWTKKLPAPVLVLLVILLGVIL
ncbi:MAG: chromate efflux transporter [Erysipelotrichaceae bacterium]